MYILYIIQLYIIYIPPYDLYSSLAKIFFLSMETGSLAWLQCCSFVLFIKVKMPKGEECFSHEL